MKGETVFSFLRKVYALCGAQQTLYLFVTGDSSPRENRPGRDADQSNLALMVRMSGAMPPNPYRALWLSMGQVYLYNKQ